VVSIRL